MLQSIFNWAKKGQVGSKKPTVFATVTIHHSLDRLDTKTSDVVYYANGYLGLDSKTPGQEILTNTIQCWTNKTQDIIIPPKPSDGDVLPEVIKDLFPPSPKLKLLVSVNQTGLITVGKLINDKLIGGMPASIFQATCQDELLTGIVDIAGKAVCTVSFSLGYIQLIS